MTTKLNQKEPKGKILYVLLSTV